MSDQSDQQDQAATVSGEGSDPKNGQAQQAMPDQAYAEQQAVEAAEKASTGGDTPSEEQS